MGEIGELLELLHGPLGPRFRTVRGVLRHRSDTRLMGQARLRLPQAPHGRAELVAHRVFPPESRLPIGRRRSSASGSSCPRACARRSSRALRSGTRRSRSSTAACGPSTARAPTWRCRRRRRRRGSACTATSSGDRCSTPPNGSPRSTSSCAARSSTRVAPLWNGIEMDIARPVPGLGAPVQVLCERSGTKLHLSSSTIGEDALVDLAASMQRVA